MKGRWKRRKPVQVRVKMMIGKTFGRLLGWNWWLIMWKSQNVNKRRNNHRQLQSNLPGFFFFVLISLVIDARVFYSSHVYKSQKRDVLRFTRTLLIILQSFISNGSFEFARVTQSPLKKLCVPQRIVFWVLVCTVVLLLHPAVFRLILIRRL